MSESRIELADDGDCAKHRGENLDPALRIFSGQYTGMAIGEYLEIFAPAGVADESG